MFYQICDVTNQTDRDPALLKIVQVFLDCSLGEELAYDVLKLERFRTRSGLVKKRDLRPTQVAQ